MLLDEPFAGVDPISVSDIKNGILDLKTEVWGVLITDHNVKETLDICDRAYIVHEGHVIAAGEPEKYTPERNREKSLSWRQLCTMRP